MPKEAACRRAAARVLHGLLMAIDFISLLPEGYTQDEQRGPVYTAPPQEIDDLTQIHGIGEVLEAQLNLNGVYRLEQIASWDQANIEAFSSLMPCFQDRIERNYWILQSQRIVERRQQAKRTSAIISPGLPASTWRTALVMTCSLLLGFLLVRWLDGSELKTYRGYLRAHTFHTRALSDGLVKRVLVREGEQVLEGQEVVRLSNASLVVARQQKSEEVELLSERVEKSLAQAELDLAWRIREIDGEILTYRRAMDEGRLIPEANPDHPRIEPGLPATAASLGSRDPFIFFSAGGSSVQLTRTAEIPVVRSSTSSDIQPVTTSADRMKARIEELEKLKKSLRSSVERASGVQAARAEHNRAKTELRNLESANEQESLSAGGFGIVSQCLLSEGDAVQSGEPILELVDSRQQHVAVLVPSQEVDLIRPGMKVSLYFPGELRRRGRVTSLPVRTSQTAANGDSLVEVRIEPMGGLWPVVPIGAQVRVAVE